MHIPILIDHESESYSIGTLSFNNSSVQAKEMSNFNFEVMQRKRTFDDDDNQSGDEDAQINSIDQNSTFRGNADKQEIGNKSTQVMTTEKMKNYLLDPTVFCVLIMHAKVAQKSYGQEKRFFCPPPCVYLQGNGWDRLGEKLGEEYELNAFIGIGGDNEMQTPEFHSNKRFGLAKTLHINDKDTRKNFQLECSVLYKSSSASASIVDLGKFCSRKIRVISKPSKKKQGAKNLDMCMYSSSRVALFNRLRSQTVSTRYLHVDGNGNFHASSTHWGAFIIHWVDENEDEGEEFNSQEGPVYYGHTIKLVCSVTGIALPQLIIRRVDKTTALLDNAHEPVSQLHKCAFQVKGTGKHYLCLNQDKVELREALPEDHDTTKVALSDGAIWTIISTDQALFNFSVPSGPFSAVTPVPFVNRLHVIKSSESRAQQNGEEEAAENGAILELNGENFTPNLTVWFRHVPCETHCRAAEILTCIVPHISNFHSPNDMNNSFEHGNDLIDDVLSDAASLANGNICEVAIHLVRNDGVIYPTDLMFTYTQDMESNAL